MEVPQNQGGIPVSHDSTVRDTQGLERARSEQRGQQDPIGHTEPITRALGNLGPRTQLKGIPLTSPTPKPYGYLSKVLEKMFGSS